MTSTPFIPFALPDVTSAEIDAVVEVLRSGWVTTGPRSKEFETSASPSAVGCGPRRGGELVHGCAAPRARGARGEGRRRGHRAHHDLRRDRGGGPLRRRHARPRRRPGLRSPRRRRRGGARRDAAYARHHAGPLRRMRRRHGRGDRAGASPWAAGGRGLGARLPLRVPGAERRHAGRHLPASPSTPPRPSPPARAAAAVTENADWADRMRIMSLHGISTRRLEALHRRGLVVLRDRGAGLQVQPDRHRGRAGAGPALARRGDAGAPRAPSRRATTRPSAAWRRSSSSTLPADRTTPGTSTS